MALRAYDDSYQGVSLHYKWIALSNTTLGILMASLTALSTGLAKAGLRHPYVVQVSHTVRATLLGHAYFPSLIAPPFMEGLREDTLVLEKRPVRRRRSRP